MTAALDQLFTDIQQIAPNPSLQFSAWVNSFFPGPAPPDIPDLTTAPASAMCQLDGIRKVMLRSGLQRPLIRVTDGNLDVMCELRGEVSCSVEDIGDDTGKLTIEIDYDNWLVDWMTHQTMDVADLNIILDPIPTQPDWRTRWGGKITEIHVKRDDKGIHSIAITALHFREHAKRLLIAANPIFPPEVQLPRMWVMPGPMRTIGFVTSFINLARLFMPGWSAITNIANPAGWINPLNLDAAANILPTMWPIQPAFVDPVLDQSRWTTLGATWTTWHDSYKDLLTDSGCQMRFYTYLTTDPDSPNFELANILTLAPDLLAMLGIDTQQMELLSDDLASLVAPLRNCVVVAFEQIDGVTGATGTAVDGLVNTVAVTLDDLITPIAIDPTTGDTYDPGQVLNGEPVENATGIGQTYLLEQLVGAAPAPPKVIWWDGEWNGLINTDLIWHKGSVKTVMTGSKSPTIVNEAQTFAIRFGLDQIQKVITANIDFGAGVGGGPAPIGAGLDNLYQGQLDNTLLAWQRFTDPIRALYAGDMAWQEHFEKGSGTAYTLASILTLRSGDWKTRTFASFMAKSIGWEWIANVDYNVGDRVGFEQEGIIYVDNVASIKRQWDWKTPLVVQASIGDNKNKGDPFAAAFKTIGAVYSFVGQLAGEGTIFEA